MFYIAQWSLDTHLNFHTLEVFEVGENFSYIYLFILGPNIFQIVWVCAVDCPELISKALLMLHVQLSDFVFIALNFLEEN